MYISIASYVAIVLGASDCIFHTRIFTILQPFGLKVVPALTPQQDPKIIEAFALPYMCRFEAILLERKKESYDA
jgi:hypothetical protein